MQDSRSGLFVNIRYQDLAVHTKYIQYTARTNTNDHEYGLL